MYVCVEQDAHMYIYIHMEQHAQLLSHSLRKLMAAEQAKLQSKEPVDKEAAEKIIADLQHELEAAMQDVSACPTKEETAAKKAAKGRGRGRGRGRGAPAAKAGRGKKRKADEVPLDDGESSEDAEVDGGEENEITKVTKRRNWAITSSPSWPTNFLLDPLGLGLQCNRQHRYGNPNESDT